MALVAVAAGCAEGGDEVSAAGVIAYARVGDTTYLLIADHKLGSSRGWGAFGGYRDAGETAAEAALREFHEETACAYIDDGLTLDAGRSHVDVGSYRSYPLEVAYREPADVARGMPHPVCDGPAASERGPWTWVPKAELLAAIRAAAPGERILLPARYVPDVQRRWVWPRSAAVIERTEALGLLP